MKTLQYTLKTSLQKIFCVKTGIFCAAFLILAWTYDQPYLQFVKEKEYPISWCVFPFYMTSYSILSIFYFGIIYINSDVPFLQHVNMYQVIRVGRKRWAFGQVGGILLRSFFAVAFSAFAAILPFIGRLEFSGEWGKMIKTLSAQRGADNYGMDAGQTLEFRFFYEILNEFTPVQLMLITILLCTLICTFLGVLMLLISLSAGKIAGVVSALVFVAALFVVENVNGPWKLRIAHFVPTYWAEVALLKTIANGRFRLPPLWYMFTVLVLAILIMSVLIYRKAKHMEFHWENEDM